MALGASSSSSSTSGSVSGVCNLLGNVNGFEFDSSSTSTENRNNGRDDDLIVRREKDRRAAMAHFVNDDKSRREALSGGNCINIGTFVQSFGVTKPH